MAFFASAVGSGQLLRRAASLLWSTARSQSSRSTSSRQQTIYNINNLQTHTQSRMAATAQEAASEVEPAKFGRTADEEIIDLTHESSVVDFTYNDDVVFVEQSRQRQNQEFGNQSFSDSHILCSDHDDSVCRGSDVLVTSELSNKLGKEGAVSSHSSGTVRCPICMDGYTEIIRSGRLIVSTQCGHIFCSQCLYHSLSGARSCPTCRKKLSHKQYHPIYI